MTPDDSRQPAPLDAGLGLRSERLVLRRFTMDDLPLLVELNSCPEVMRWLGGPRTPEETEQMLRERVIAYYAANPGLGIWATQLRSTGECIGMHLINHIQGESLIQVGYRLFRKHWGRGYATEMTRVLIEHGFRRLGLERISAITALENTASQHVLTKAGLPRLADRFFAHPAYAPFGPQAYFERSAQDWLSANKTKQP